MDNNVPVDQSSNSIDRTIPSSSSSSLFASAASEQTATSVPVQITGAFSPLAQKSSLGESSSSLSSRKGTMLSSSSSISKLKTDVDQLDNLVKDLLSEVNRPVHSKEDQSISTSSQQTLQEPVTLAKSTDLDSSSNATQRTKTVREERIRIKRGANMEIPPTTTTLSSSIDEQLIDSLLESVQNTLRKRSQQQQSTGWTNTLPVHHPTGPNRRAYSSSSAYTDSVHRMDPGRSRFPIKLSRAGSPTSTLSSRRQDSRDGYISGSTTTIPTHFRATSEPPPEGPIELRRMDLVRSPSRTYLEGHPQEYQYYSRSAMPARGMRLRGYEQSGYDTDTGLISGRAYGPRYYRSAPPPPPQPMYHPYSHQRSMFRPDGYDTDSGLISSGRLHMTRTLPPRMAVIPETVVLNNRLVSASRLNPMPSGHQLRANPYRGESLTGYDTDSSLNTRQHYNYNDYRQIPVQREYIDQRWINRESPARPIPPSQEFVDHHHQPRPEPVRSTSIPVVTQGSAQEKKTTSTSLSLPKGKMNIVKKDLSIIPMIFPGTVGLSNPLSLDRTQPQQQRSSEVEVKRVSPKEQPVKRAARPQGGLMESVVIAPSVDPAAPKVEQVSTTTEITSAVNIEVPVTKVSSTIPSINQSHHANVQARVGNSASRTQDENSRRSSLSSATDSDAHRSGVYQAHNVSQFWYKEKMSREDAINALKSKTPGAFLIRDSQGFPGSFGLAVKVETLPPGIQSKPGADPNAELVRHYLIERTATGHVRLKGCPNEPEFASLSALVHQHTLSSLALPIKLVLPTVDVVENYRSMSSSNPQHEAKKMTIKDLLEKGAACNVLYLNNVDVESLSGQMAVAKALNSTFEQAERLQAVIVNFKVSTLGITLVDTKKKLFSRRHFPKENVTYCGADYEGERVWTHQYPDLEMLPRARCFGFISKKVNGTRSSTSENECHVFAEVDPSQPASAIVNFVSKVMIGSVPV